MTGRNSRNIALDGLRGVAIAMVVSLHLVNPYLPLGHTHVLGWLRAGLGICWSGVDLFFALSGFFIGGILIDHRNSAHLVRVFYVRRAARILPLYYATLGVLAVLIALGLGGAHHEFKAWVYPAFLTNLAVGFAGTWDWLPLSVLWSLAVEEQFYIVAPWITRAIPEAGIPILAVILAVSAEIFRIVFVALHPGGSVAIHVVTAFRMDALALGVLAAWVTRAKGDSRIVRFLEGRWAVVLFACVAVFAGIDLHQPDLGGPFLAYFGYLGISVACSVIVVIISRIQPRPVLRVLEFAPLVNLGRHAYFIYLWHGIIGAIIIEKIGGPAFVLNSMSGLAVEASALGATWAAAIISWKVFEGPIVAWSRREAY